MSRGVPARGLVQRRYVPGAVLTGSPCCDGPVMPSQVSPPFLAAHLSLVRPIGQGGMGTVWLAADALRGRDVAVKVIAAEIAARPTALARFRREAETALRVVSPHVVKVLEHGVSREGQAFLVMELVRGVTLEEHLDARGRLAAEEVRGIVRQLARALASLHGAGIVHRDLKPSNVMMSESGEVTLIDLGLARATGGGAASAVTTGRPLLGTPSFMSPEQLDGARDIGPRADVWALGVLSFLLLTGRSPFEGEGIAARMVAIRGERPRITDCVPGLPARIDAWFARACALAVNDRFGSVDACAAELERCLSDVVSEARSPSTSTMTISAPFEVPRQRPQRAERTRHTSAFVGALLTAVGLAALATGALYRIRAHGAAGQVR